MKKNIYFTLLILLTMLVFNNAYTETEINNVDETDNVKWLVEPQYEDAGDFSEGLAAVSINGKYGYINNEGLFVIKPQFDVGFKFHEGVAWVSIKGKAACINKDGKILFGNKNFYFSEYDNNIFSEGLSVVCVKKNPTTLFCSKYTYVDKEGKFITKQRFESASDFKNGLAMVKIKDKMGFINKEGKLLKNKLFTSCGDFRENLAEVEIKGKCGFINEDGNFAIEPQFDNTMFFSEGLAPVKKDGKWGYIDKNGDYIISPKFDEAYWFEGGFADVIFDGQNCLIDKNGTIIFTHNYEQIESFKNGFGSFVRILVGRIGKFGYINLKGEVIIEPGEISSLSNEDRGAFPGGLQYVRSSSDFRYGYIDIYGNYIIQCQFDDAENFCEGFAAVSLNGKYGYIINPLSTNKEQSRALININPIVEGDLSDDINTNFIEACTNGDIAKVTDLFGKGANIEYQDDDGRTPLMHACDNGHIEIVNFLLSKKANVNASNNNGLTALFMSICQKRDNKTLKNNKLKIMKLLIKNGADVNARVNMDFYGKMTIMELIKFNEKTERQEGGQICPESIKILKAAGAR